MQHVWLNYCRLVRSRMLCCFHCILWRSKSVSESPVRVSPECGPSDGPETTHLSQEIKMNYLDELIVVKPGFALPAYALPASRLAKSPDVAGQPASRRT